MRTITLGEATVPVVAQRHAYLRHRLGESDELLTDALSGGEQTIEGFLSGLGAGAYDLLAILVPALPDHMPRHAFLGYATTEAMDAGRYDPEADRSPTIPEIVGAFSAAAEENKLDLFTGLKGLLDPKLVQQIMSGLVEDILPQMLEAAKQARESQTSPPSTPLPSQNGASQSMSGTPSAQTSEPSEASPSPASSGS